MTGDDTDNDPLFEAVARLRMRDVDQRRGDRLRRRCHSVIESQRRRRARDGTLRPVSFWRVIGPAVAGVWCVVYLAEIIRRAAEVYGF
jgi:hypothetical protein